MQVMSNIRPHQRFQRMALIGQIMRRVVDYAAQVAALRDQIHLTGFESTTDDPAATPLFDSIEFADGDVMIWDDMLAQGFDLDCAFRCS